jgi:hypothetical protein
LSSSLLIVLLTAGSATLGFAALLRRRLSRQGLPPNGA